MTHGRAAGRAAIAWSPVATLYTARRVLRQLTRDGWSTILTLLVPCALMWLMKVIFTRQPWVFDRVGPQAFGIFPFIVMYLVASVATLRERTWGTMERLLAGPIHRLDLIAGYTVAFGVLALVQATLVALFATGPLGMVIAGPRWLLMVTAILAAQLGVALGLWVSAFAASEFQAVQFLAAAVLPQVMLCGLYVPLAELPTALHALAQAMPMTYAVDATTQIATHPHVTSTLLRDIVVVAACQIAALAVSATTIRRRTP